MRDDYVIEVENNSEQWVINKILEKVSSTNIIQDKKQDKKQTNTDKITDDDIVANADLVLDTNRQDTDAKISRIGESIKSYKEMMKETKDVLLNGSDKATPAYTGVNRPAIGNSAYNYAEKPYNPNYLYIDYADCTNFASQAVKYAGVPTSQYWCAYTNKWIRVKEFYSYMNSNGYLTSVSGCLMGDIFQWRKPFADFTHTTMVSYIDSNGGIYLSAHSNDRKNHPIANYWAAFTANRKMHFW